MSASEFNSDILTIGSYLQILLLVTGTIFITWTGFQILFKRRH